MLDILQVISGSCLFQNLQYLQHIADEPQLQISTIKTKYPASS
jgi:hypothetical protein